MPITNMIASDVLAINEVDSRHYVLRILLQGIWTYQKTKHSIIQTSW